LLIVAAPQASQTLEPEKVLRMSAPVTSVALSPDNDTLAFSLDKDSSFPIRLLGIRKGTSVDLLGHSEEVLATAFSPNGHVLATTGFDKKILLWDMKSKTVLKKHALELPARELEFLDNKSLFFWGGNEAPKLWDTGPGNGQKLLAEPCSVAALCPKSQTVVTGYGLLGWRSARAGEMKLWSMACKKPLGALKGPPAELSSISVSMDGNYVASGDEAGRIRLWDTNAQRLVAQIKGHSREIQQVRFLRSGRLVSTDYGGSIRVWNVSKEGIRLAYALRKHVHPIRGITPTSDHQGLISCDDGGLICFWKLPQAGN
jgi:WD40 repeat protein